MEYFKRIEASLLEITTPIEGDFVEYETGKFARISVDHRDGRFQLSNSVGIYVSDSSSLASGCVWDPDLDYLERNRLTMDNLISTGKTMLGRCWTFISDFPHRDKDVYAEIQFKVWKLGTKVNGCRIEFGNERAEALAPLMSEIIEVHNKFFGKELEYMWVDFGKEVYDIHFEFKLMGEENLTDIYLTRENDSLVENFLYKGFDYSLVLGKELAGKVLEKLK